MKKIIILIGMLFLLTGCVNINDYKYDDLVQKFAVKSFKVNTYRTGYKYYLPVGMRVVNSTMYNEVIEDDLYEYYLYVDLVSYEKNKEQDYEISEKSIYSKEISYKDKKGYLEINLIQNDKYLVEIMYNYAKIEVIVDKDNSNRAVLSAINILKSIEYNDSVIANLLGEDILKFYEEKYDIFSTVGNNNNYIIKDEDYDKDTYEEEVYDSDLIN